MSQGNEIPPPTAAHLGAEPPGLPPVGAMALPPGANPLHLESLTDGERERSKKNSGITAIGIAVVVHALIILIALLIIVTEAMRDTPSIEVSGDGSDETPTLETQKFNQRVTRRPSSASNRAIPTITPTAETDIAIPEVEDFVDDPIDFGSMGIGEGLGFGTAGDGMGGAEFLGLRGGGKDIVLVIDTSSSMPLNCGPEGIEAIRKEISKTVNALAPATRFNIITYANDADLWRDKPVPANAENKRDALAFMEGYFGRGPFTRTRTEKFAEAGVDSEGVKYVPMPPNKVEILRGTSGGSRIDLGLVLAFEMKPSTVFILSDGAPSTTLDGRRLDQRDILRLVKDKYDEVFAKESGSGPTVNSVTINGEGEAFLKDISRTFNGKHRDIQPDRL